jgi:hypothetical protein
MPRVVQKKLADFLITPDPVRGEEGDLWRTERINRKKRLSLEM